MRDKFITHNKLKELLKDAMHVYIASAYLSRAAIDDIKSVLNELPNKGGRLFRFLLDKDFHPEPQMQQVLVNMLLEIPNAEVKIYRGPELFHPKIYIFESGNRICTAIGSFNATEGGARNNIEGGVQVNDNELQREIREFFEKWWNHVAAEKAVRDPAAVYVAKKYKPGDSVIFRATKEVGIILNLKPEFDNDSKEWLYTIYIAGQSRQARESEIETLRIAIYSNETCFQGTVTDLEAWMRNYVLEKEGEQADNTIAAIASTRTILLPYQFRPLMKLLHNEQQRLLIADEVGLGKTIEAGIILKELVCRGSADSVLIIAPNSLKTKWRDELEIRFDEYFSILNSEDMVSYLEEFERIGKLAPLHGIITYDQMITKSVQRVLKRLAGSPPFDLVIIDEAHWLKNPDTIRHKIVKKATKCALSLVMMTATPIQLETADLFHLLGILLPELADNLDSIAFSASLTINHRINQAISFLKQRRFDEFMMTINELTSTRIFRHSLERLDNYQPIIARCLEANSSLSDAELSQLAGDIYTLNALNQFINRTLRREVAEQFADRNIVTWEYSYTVVEARVYDAIIKACQELHNLTGRSSFAVITPERRAASCLRAMYDDLVGWEEVESEAENDNAEDDSENESISRKDIKASHRAARKALEQIPLPEMDSKFEELKKIIRQCFENVSLIRDQKIMIFCVFKATIRYLKGRLIEEFQNFRVESIDGDDPIPDRDKKRAIFGQDDKPAILICSEVAGEGLDFQFCHTLINYDMPWNPSKLEQRAGRIDRMGQEASVVNIINLVNKRTIEDHIMALLFKRIKLFSNTLGPLGEVVDRYQKEFTRRILTHNRTDAAQEAYERQVIANIENKVKTQAKFEEQQVEIFSAVNYVYDELGKRRIRFLESEIKLIWDAFLGDMSKRVNRDGDLYSLNVDEDVKAKLLEALGHRGCLPPNMKRDFHYKELISSLSQERKSLQYTFSRNLALQRLSVQFLNIGHPLIQGAIHTLRREYHPNREIVTCCLSQRLLPLGSYLFSFYRFSILDSKSMQRKYVEDQAYAYNIIDHTGTWNTKEEIIQILIDEAKPYNDDSAPDKVIRALSFLTEAAKAKAEEVLRDYEKLESMSRNSKKSSLMRLYASKIKRLEKDLSFIHDQKLRNTRLEEIETLRGELNHKMAEFELGDLRISTRCTGLILIRSLEGENARDN